MQGAPGRGVIAAAPLAAARPWLIWTSEWPGWPGASEFSPVLVGSAAQHSRAASSECKQSHIPRPQSVDLSIHRLPAPIAPLPWPRHCHAAADHPATQLKVGPHVGHAAARIGPQIAL